MLGMITDFKNKVKDLLARLGSKDDSYPKGTLGRTDDGLRAKTNFRLKFVAVPSIATHSPYL
jgi:hypothetical protein